MEASENSAMIFNLFLGSNGWIVFYACRCDHLSKAPKGVKPLLVGST